jgi:hypothetical protein
LFVDAVAKALNSKNNNNEKEDVLSLRRKVLIQILSDESTKNNGNEST